MPDEPMKPRLAVRPTARQAHFIRSMGLEDLLEEDQRDPSVSD